MIMKKEIVFMAAFLFTIGAYANILRVNNVDSSAPYASIAAAVTAAVDGDTIIVDGTSVDYDGATINKRLVVIGPGYWLRENGIATESAHAASVAEINVQAEGCVIMGLCINAQLIINGAKTVITRCWVKGNLSIESNINYCVIHQNMLGGDAGSGYGKSFYHQITNNIFGNIGCHGVHESYIAYNTSYKHWGESFWNTANSKIEKNIFYTSDINEGDGNTIQDNYIVGDSYQDIETDKDVRDTKLPSVADGYGAFAGNDPYRISGIPAGPMIEELTIPTSVEEGTTMEVTIKLGSTK